MTKALLIAALTVMSASAYASKARVAALGGSATVKDDFQDVFTNPSYLGEMPDMFTIEYGGTSTNGSTTTPNAEGGIVRAMGDAKLGFYVGRQYATWTALRDAAFGTGADLRANLFATGAVTAGNWGTATAVGTGHNNAFDIIYAGKMGDMTWGVDLYYSSSKTENAFKSSAMNLGLGVMTAQWAAYIQQALGSKISADNSFAGYSTNSGTTVTSLGSEWELKQDSSTTLGGRYDLNGVLLFGSYTMWKGTLATPTAPAGLSSSTASTFKNTTLQIGAEDKIAGEGHHFFYGAALNMPTSSSDRGVSAAPELKTQATTLPLWFGVEADATSWLVLRTSLKQNVLLTETKTDTVSGTTVTSTKSNGNSTVATLGAGLKFGKLMIDGTVAGSTAYTAAGVASASSTQSSGTFGFANIMTNASMTYNF